MSAATALVLMRRPRHVLPICPRGLFDAFLAIR